MKKHILTIFFGLLACFIADIHAQSTYPVQVYTQLVPPYTPHVPMYYTGMQPKLRVTLINTDMNQPLLNVRLRMKITSSSFSLTTPEHVYTPSIELPAGMPVQLTLDDLAVYFKRENLRVTGGQSEFYRTQLLPDNFYRFHFEACETTTGKAVSNANTGFTQAMIAAGDPPVLNLPEKGSAIKESNIPSIFFSWTPKHMNSVASAYGTEYQITLVEIYDRQVAPEAAFAYSREIYTETVRSTSFIHTLAQPVLLPGFRYAWRVRAVAREGVDEVSVFKNNGESPIHWFDYTADCKTVQTFGAIYENGYINITWMDVDALDYTVEYRKKGSSRWYTGNITAPGVCKLYNLQFGTEYEYRIGTHCLINDPFDYTGTKVLQIPEKTVKGPDCGLMPDLALKNRTPVQQLLPGLPVYAGDFPVFITQVSGAGSFTGKGYVGIPYLNNAKVAVTFNNIQVNTDNQLIAGYFETTYDAATGITLFADDTEQGGGITDDRTYPTVDFTIDPTRIGKAVFVDDAESGIREGDDYDIQKGENGYYLITLYDEDGNEHEIKADSLPALVEDADGDVYSVGENGNIGLLDEASVFSSEDKSISMVEQDFLFVAINDTLYNNHTVNLLSSSTSIPIEPNILRSRFIIPLPPNGTLTKGLTLDSIFNGELVEWTMSDNKGVEVHPKFTGSEYNINREQEGSYTLTIDARPAISVPYTDTITGQQHIFTYANDSVFAKECRMKLKINIQNTGILKFSPENDDYYKYYGFDDALQLECRQSGDYGAPIQIAGADYYVPTLYIQPNQDAVVKLECEYTYALLKNNPSYKILLESNNSELLISGKNKEKLSLLSSQNCVISVRKNISTTIDAYLIDESLPNSQPILMGRLAVVSQELRSPKKVRIVSVRRSDEDYFLNVDKQAVINNLNELYKQAFIQFELDRSQNYKDTLRISLTGNNIISLEYLKDSTNYIYDRAYYHIFIIDGKGANTNNGEAYFPMHGIPYMSVVFATNKDLVAHEIGHVLGLDHTFESSITRAYGTSNNYREVLYNDGRVLIPEYSTRNIMDYIRTGDSPERRRFFYKYQIDFLK